MTTILIEAHLEVFTCIKCGMVYAIPGDYASQKRRDHENFYCPAGHPQHFPAKSDVDLAKAEVEKYKKLYKEEQRYAAQKIEERNAAQRQLAATKAAHTRTKKRIANGVCPCCNRHFENLDRHMQGQHPEYAKEAV